MNQKPLTESTYIQNLLSLKILKRRHELQIESQINL